MIDFARSSRLSIRFPDDTISSTAIESDVSRTKRIFSQLSLTGRNIEKNKSPIPPIIRRAETRNRKGEKTRGQNEGKRGWFLGRCGFIVNVLGFFFCHPDEGRICFGLSITSRCFVPQHDKKCIIEFSGFFRNLFYRLCIFVFWSPGWRYHSRRGVDPSHPGTSTL